MAIRSMSPHRGTENQQCKVHSAGLGITQLKSQLLPFHKHLLWLPTRQPPSPLQCSPSLSVSVNLTPNLSKPVSQTIPTTYPSLKAKSWMRRSPSLVAVPWPYLDSLPPHSPENPKLQHQHTLLSSASTSQSGGLLTVASLLHLRCHPPSQRSGILLPSCQLCPYLCPKVKQGPFSFSSCASLQSLLAL